MEWHETIQSEVDTMRTVRDELRVQIHLASAEAREQWERLEKRWEHLEGRAQRLTDSSKESIADVAAAVDLVLDEIRDGYRELRSLL